MPSLQAFLALVLSGTSYAKHVTYPLTHYKGETQRDSHSLHAGTKRQIPDNSVFQSAPFWYGSFDIGDSKNLTMIIDSGAPFITIVTPDIYKPSAQSAIGNKTYQNPGSNHTVWSRFQQTQANGCGNLLVWWDGYQDTVVWEDLTVKHQRFAVANRVNLHHTNTETQLIYPYQGIMGFAIDAAAQLGVGGYTFVTNLYRQGQIEEPRFGLALGTTGEGKLVLGGIDSSLLKGDITEVLIDEEWGIAGASVTSNGTTVFEKQGLFFDSGGPSINASPEIVRALFEQAGIEAIETETECGKSVYGYYRCDAPPQIGFKIGGKVFDIEPEALKWKDDGANNCTAIVVGLEGFRNDVWTVGNAFMQGKYLDHHAQNRSMGFAILNSPTQSPGSI